MPKSTTINPAKFSVRTMVPLYARNDSDYAPWIIGHEDELMLSAEHLTAQFNAFKWSGYLADSAPDSSPSCAFSEWLEQHGYVVFWTQDDPEPFYIPISDEEYTDLLDTTED